MEEITPVKDGSVIGTLICAIDLGDYDSTYEGETSIKPQMRLVFELPGSRKETKDGLKPYTTKVKYLTKYSGEKSKAYAIASALGRDISGMKPNEVLETFIDLIGESCLVSVENAEYNGNKYVRITKGGFMQIPEAMKSSIPVSTIESMYFSFDEKDALERIEGFPTRLQSDLKKSHTFKKLEEESMKEEKDDDLPF